MRKNQKLEVILLKANKFYGIHPKYKSLLILNINLKIINNSN